jgi:hypothetical protein
MLDDLAVLEPVDVNDRLALTAVAVRGVLEIS